MNKSDASLLKDLEASLQIRISGEVRFDLPTRILYSTDASIYQIEPIGVVFPKTTEDLAACVEIASKYPVPVLPRGAGSSLAGQSIGPALILDCSKHLNQLIEINPKEKTANVAPGVILSSLNQAAAIHGLQFGPDPASAERATIGGSLANNATGTHSIQFGMAADHFISAEIILSDGTQTQFEPIPYREAVRRAERNDLEGAIYRSSLKIRERDDEEIRRKWPKTWRRASGYNLNYLIPWSSTAPPEWQIENLDGLGEGKSTSNRSAYPPILPGVINLTPLLAGSEGTLAIIEKATLRLVNLPKEKILVLVAFDNLTAACAEVPGILDRSPSAIELIPSNLIRMARNIPAYAKQVSFIDSMHLTLEDVPNLLVVEFSGNDFKEIKSRALDLIHTTQFPMLLAEEPEVQNNIWAVRKVGLGLLMSLPGKLKPISFIEDLSVPVEKLVVFVTEMQKILASHGSSGDYYAHASAGCLHMRPLLNPKSSDFSRQLRSVATEAVDLVIRLGGSVSGEHGDGIARSEWLGKMFGERIVSAFREIKRAADPQGILNPGKIVDPFPMDANFRSQSRNNVAGWQSVMSFNTHGGLAGAVDLCNGAGVCRKENGVMCPSYQFTREEMHSTRGRANLLRALLSGQLSIESSRSIDDVYTALDLCIACKGCKSECPSAVDMAKLKYEFLEYYHSCPLGKRRELRDYLFAYIDRFARLGIQVKTLSNSLIYVLNRKNSIRKLFGLSTGRQLPLLSTNSFHRLFKERSNTIQDDNDGMKKVIFISDPFTEYFQPEVGLAAVEVLATAGIKTLLLPIIGTGRILISKGFLNEARTHAEEVIDSIRKIDPYGEFPIVGIEPSEIYTLRDEYLDFFPGVPHARSLADRAFMVDEYLLRAGKGNIPNGLRIDEDEKVENQIPTRVLVHGHCYQKAQLLRADGYPCGVQATKEMLERVGYSVEIIDSGCCGMAGAFGYEANHFNISMGIGELSLFPAIRAASPDTILAASGFSCLTQIEDGTGKKAIHPITLLLRRH